MQDPSPLSAQRPAALARALALTRLGLFAERATQAFWPLLALVLATLSALMFGLQDVLPLEAVWALAALVGLAALAALIYAARRFRWPSKAEAEARLDATLPGRPLQTLADRQAIGAGDAASEAVWRAHLARMVQKLGAARPVEPDLRVSSRDPYALRYMALIAFVMALLFGSVWRVASVAGLGHVGGGTVAGAEASWEGWAEPPRFTGKPSLYLADLPAGAVSLPEGTVITIRLYGDTDQLAVRETVSGRTEVSAPSEPVQSFAVTQDGSVAIEGPNGRAWNITTLSDLPPTIVANGPAERTVKGEMKLSFIAEDDYGVLSAKARIALDEAKLDRRYGLTLDPESRDAIEIDLPLRVRGDRRKIDNIVTENLSEHPWAHLPVTVTLLAWDAAEQEGAAAPAAMVLPGRRFFDTMAAALVENRRDLLWNRANAVRTAQVLRAISWQPETGFNQSGVYLKLRAVILRLEAEIEKGPLSDEFRDEVAAVLWDLALEIEDSTLDSALERMREAQRRLSEAIRNGATPDEIAKLMDELRRATEAYTQMLAEQAPDGTDTPQQGQQGQTITGDQIAEMMQRLQELMEQGRTAEAQALLEQLQQLLENMQVTRGQGGGPGEESMRELGDALRGQEELSDDTFGDLNGREAAPERPGQRQPGQGGRRGAPERRPGEQGQGQQGQGQQGEGQQGQQDQGQGQGEGQGQAQDGQGERPDGQNGQGEGEDGSGGGAGQDGTDQARRGEGSLADRQRALREMIERQQGRLPGAGTAEGEAAREALEGSAEAMERAEEALRNGDLGGALDEQAEAMEGLREGMRRLGEQMAREARPGEGREGQELGQTDGPGGQRDPLGRNPSGQGQMTTDEQALQGEDVYRRARELLDELRRRAGEQSRSSDELDYLKRLLERF